MKNRRSFSSVLKPSLLLRAEGKKKKQRKRKKSDWIVNCSASDDLRDGIYQDKVNFFFLFPGTLVQSRSGKKREREMALCPQPIHPCEDGATNVCIFQIPKSDLALLLFPSLLLYLHSDHMRSERHRPLRPPMAGKAGRQARAPRHRALGAAGGGAENARPQFAVHRVTASMNYAKRLFKKLFFRIQALTLVFPVPAGAAILAILRP